MSGLRDRVERLEKSCRDLNDLGTTTRAWERIEKHADRLVAKAGETDQQRVARYLQTPAGRQDWQRWNEASDARRDVVEKVEASVAASSIESWAAERITDRIAKAEAAGFGPDEAVRWARESDPDAWRVLRQSTSVSKSAEPAETNYQPERVRLSKAQEQFLRDLRGVDGGSPLPRSRPERGPVRKADGLYVDLDLGDEDEGW